jgi:polyphosphate kinase
MTADTSVPALTAPQLYASRELSQLDFNRRVLAQAMDETLPLLERLRFLCISSTNLDEFFEIRCAEVQRAIELNLPAGIDGLAPQHLLEHIHHQASELIAAQYHCFYHAIRPQLADVGIHLLQREQWSDAQTAWLRAYFHSDLLPVLSPIALDPGHPFPKILNKSLNVVVLLEGKDALGHDGQLAIVRAPRSLPRMIRLPATQQGEDSDTQDVFVFLSSVLSAFAHELFPGRQVKGVHQFRVTRNAELIVDEHNTSNLPFALRDELRSRGYRHAVRLEIDTHCPIEVRHWLQAQFNLADNAVYCIQGPVNLNRAIQIYDMLQRPELKFPPFQPRIPHGSDAIFELIQKEDVLLHHPFDAFTPVLELLKQAADDPDVLAIKQTLYRTGARSPITELLIQAAQNGKDVTVVVELRARFDEEANLGLADRLQDAGVQVVYGVVGYKTHAKMLMIVRREDGKLRRYVHLSTGNYHRDTARAYTDFALLTCHPGIGEDVHQIFQQLAGVATPLSLNHLLLSPFTLHNELLQRIERETQHAREGRPARIIAKMNALNEPHVIRALYQASQAGVQIDLIVRSACALRPGIAGISNTIRVRSIVGRFLEHHRIWWFANADAPELFCASADWLERNLLRRVEVAFPILSPAIAERIFNEGLQAYLADNSNAWQLLANGQYQRCTAGEDAAFSAQLKLLEPLYI